ncbi:hypothetical protein [Chelatococcus reniformis]|nr:hypothetical protein [Chelatococcus reniformis]
MGDDAMQVMDDAIAPKRRLRDVELADAIVSLYEAEPDLVGPPRALFAGTSDP